MPRPQPGRTYYRCSAEACKSEWPDVASGSPTTHGSRTSNTGLTDELGLDDYAGDYARVRITVELLEDDAGDTERPKLAAS